MEILVYGLLFGFWYLIKYGIIYPIKLCFYGIGYLIKLIGDAFRRKGHKIVKEKEHLWVKTTTATANNKKFLFIAKNENIEPDFNSFADGMQYTNEIIHNYSDIYCCVIESDKSVYNKLLAKCCEAQGITVRKTKSLQSEIDTIVRGCQRQKQVRQTNYKKGTSGYKKIFPHITTDDDDSDSEKAIDDMIFMDLMDDDF